MTSSNKKKYICVEPREVPRVPLHLQEANCKLNTGEWRWSGRNVTTRLKGKMLMKLIKEEDHESQLQEKDALDVVQ